MRVAAAARPAVVVSGAPLMLVEVVRSANCFEVVVGVVVVEGRDVDGDESVGIEEGTFWECPAVTVDLVELGLVDGVDWDRR